MLQTILSGATRGERAQRTQAGREPQKQWRGRPRAHALAGGLGWFSLGLGIAQILAPGGIARMIGVRDNRRHRKALATIGLREITSGLGILAGNRRDRWLWARVGGDVLDLAFLGSAIATRAKKREGVRLAATFGAVAGVTIIDAVTARRAARASEDVRGRRQMRRRQTATAVITINRSPEEVYGFFRAFENLPTFMANLASVDVTNETSSHWKVHGPAGMTVEWDAEIVEDRPGELISWRSLRGADVDNAGVVHFMPAPGLRGTEVHAEIRYAAPAGRLGALVAKLFGREPGQQARGDLRRLKQVLETGEVVHSDASIHRGFLHPARPPSRRFMARSREEMI